MDDECFKKLGDDSDLALKLIIQKYGKQLKKRIAKLVQSDEDLTKDIIQEVLTFIWEDAERIATMEHPFAFMMTIAKNRAISAFRAKIERTQVPIEKVYHLADVNQADTFLEYEELYQRFIKLTERLTPKEKEVVISAKLDGLDNKQLSVLYNVSIQRAKNIVSSAMKKIRTLFKD